MQLIVLGMHRSGTSVLTNALHLMGARTGGKNDLQQVSDENPRGYWEQKDVVKLNEEILNTLGADWWKISSLDINNLESNKKAKYAIRINAILDRLNGVKPWTIKDPRMCLLYRIWAEFLDSPINILVYRNPIEVAKSLKTRNGLSLQLGIALWEKYNLSALEFTTGSRRFIVSYKDLISRPYETLNEIHGHLLAFGTSGLRRLDDESIKHVIVPTLYREQVKESSEADYLNAAQHRLLRALTSREALDWRNIPLLSRGALETMMECEGKSDGPQQRRKTQKKMQKEIDYIRQQLGVLNKDLNIMKGSLATSMGARIRKLAKARRVVIFGTREGGRKALEFCERNGFEPLYFVDNNKELWGSEAFGLPIYDPNKLAESDIDFIIVASEPGEDPISLQLEDMGYVHLVSYCTLNDLWLFSFSSPDMYALIKDYKRSGLVRTRKVVVYTAIFGGYDTLTIPQHLDHDIDYICFTDREVDGYGIWKIHASPYYHQDATRIARYIKTHPHEFFADYDIAIWIDANIVIRGNVMKYVEMVKTEGASLGFILHPRRSCVYCEADACIRSQTDDARLIDQQMESYRRHGYRGLGNLYETNFMVFLLNDHLVCKLFQSWWREIDSYSRRDQLSLGWVLENSSVKIAHLLPPGLSVRNNPDFEKYPHGHKQVDRDSTQRKEHSDMQQPYDGRPFADVRSERLKAVGNHRVDVIICVHNALDDVRICLDSVRTHLTKKHRIIIVNDGSNEETSEYLRGFSEGDEHVLLVENEEKQGYTRSANRGLSVSDAEFRILLNSDTVVSANWADKMLDVALRSESIGIVGPLSNAASYQSIPDIQGSRGQTAINDLPSGVAVAELDLACERWSLADLFPIIPLVHGFCFGIKKSVIEKIGLFDEVNFPLYYGEENDYCFRARSAGFTFAVATNTYVYHSKSSSIGEEERLFGMSRAGERLRELYGEEKVKIACRQMADHPLLQRMREKANSFYVEKAR